MYDSGLETIAVDRYQGRPHPGKNNYFTAREMHAAYPRFADFVALRATLDPAGRFMNDYLHRLLTLTN